MMRRLVSLLSLVASGRSVELGIAAHHAETTTGRSSGGPTLDRGDYHGRSARDFDGWYQTFAHQHGKKRRRGRPRGPGVQRHGHGGAR